jgi:hypothetical protein
MRMERSRRRSASDVPTEEIRTGGTDRLRAPEIFSPAAAVSPGVSAVDQSARARDAALVQALATGDDVAAVTFVRRFQSAV